MTRFSTFSDVELYAMERAFYIEGLLLLADEVRRERRYRAEKNTECTSNMPSHMEPDNCGNYVAASPTANND